MHAFLPPKRAVYHVLTRQGGSLVCFANQEGTLAHVFQQLGRGGGGDPLPPLVFLSKGPLQFVLSGVKS